MQLSEFSTLAEAKNYESTKERMISHDTAVALLTKHSCVTSLSTSLDEKSKGFWLAVSSGVPEYNLMNSHPKGQEQQLLLAHLVSVGAVSQDFADDAIVHANQSHYPFANATEYDFMKAKGTCPTKQATPQNGWLKITTNADCEKHNPQIYVDIQGVKRRVAGFQNVDKAGDYIAQVPRGYESFLVDDAYGVIA